MELIDFVKNGVVMANLDVDSREEVFKILHDKLYENKNVKESFYEGLLKREDIFPTGLLLNKYNVAIPHTDPEHVNDSCIAVATLKKPVTFQCMEDSSKSVDVKVVFMLAMGQAHSHIEMLQNLIILIQNDKFLENIINAKNEDEIMKEITNTQKASII